MSNYLLQVPNDLQLAPSGNIDFKNDWTFSGSASTANCRSELGVAIGSDVQQFSSNLADIAGLALTDGNFIVADGANFVVESGATARTSLGLGSIATQASNSVSITGGSITGITDLAVADGGTGASTASDARTNLGLEIGTDIQQQSSKLQDIADLTAGAGQDGYVISWDNTAGEFVLAEDASNTYTAGNGLSLAGTEFSIDTSITCDLDTEQTLENKTLDGGAVDNGLSHESGTSNMNSKSLCKYLSTTNSTSTALHTNTMGGGTSTVATVMVKGQVVCQNQDDDNVNSYDVLAVVKRAGAEATSEVLLSNITEQEETAGYSVSVSADTTNGGYKINVVGDGTDEVKWVSFLQETQLNLA